MFLKILLFLCNIKFDSCYISHKLNLINKMNQAILDQKIIIDRVKGAVYGLLIGDALSMPVHWYYNTKDIVNDFGRIIDF